MAEVNNNDRFNKHMSKILFVSVFSSYFFHLFGPLFWIGLALVIAGIFFRPLLIVGGIFWILDLILTLFFMYRMKRMHSDHPEFDRLRQSFVNGNPAEELDKMTHEWAGDGFYTARIERFREDASSCKTVGEAFSTYKMHCLAIVTGQETYKVTLGLDKKYFMDGAKYGVISFDRMRIIDDDVECHMYCDLLYDPNELKLTKTSFSSEGMDSGEVQGFFDSVEKYLKANDLLDIPVARTNIGTDE